MLIPAIAGSGLTGGVVESLGNLASLERLDLRANIFTGELPVSLAGLDSLEYINLSFNQFSGAIPDEVVNWSDTLEEADFSGNGFTGAVPTGLCNAQLQTLVADCELECTCCTSCS